MTGKEGRSISIPDTVSYKARRAQDGEMEMGEGDGQPEYRDSTERMQDLAEEEAGEGDTANQRTVGNPIRMSFSAFKSKFEPHEKGGMVMKREEYDQLPWHSCPLCVAIHGPDGQVEHFKSLQQLSDHVKEHHDVVFYSSTTYSQQQVLCGRLVKAAHMWLSKKNETFGNKGPNKERKIKRKNNGGASDPFLDAPYEVLTTNATPVPPKLTAEKVDRGPLVRPQYPVTLMATHDMTGRNIHCASCAVCVQSWSVKASQGLLGSDSTQIMRQIDPIYSPRDLFPAPSGETPMGWFTPHDAKMIIRLTGNPIMEKHQRLVFALFMAAIQLIRESRLRPRLMDSVFNFMNVGIMISPTPMRQYMKSQYGPEEEKLYNEDEWEYPIAVHGMVASAEEETQRVGEWQDLFGKYNAKSLPLPPDRVYHLQCDTPDLLVRNLDQESSGLADKDTPIPLMVQRFCHMGLSHQAVAQATPTDTIQAESHGLYDVMITKYRESLNQVQTYVGTKSDWVKLMKGSMMDDAAESAVHIHADKAPDQVSTVRTKIKTITAGIWDMLKRLTEQLAPSVVKTPATVATRTVQEPEADPSEFGDSVPENTVITPGHNRRYDWETFAQQLLSEVMRAPKETKPMIDHKAPPLFIWHENKAWDAVSRLSHHFDIEAPDPWTCDEYNALAQAGCASMVKSNSKESSALNNWIYTWAYTRQPAQNEDQTPDAVTLPTYLTVLWMTGLVKASETQKTSIDRLFSDGDRSDLFRFLSKCSEIIDPRVRKAVSHYGHVPLLYALDDGTQHYPGTDTLWADKGNTFYAWLCDKRGYFKEYNLNPESKGDLLEVCFNLYYMHAVLNIDLPQLFQMDTTYVYTWSLQWVMLQRDLHVLGMSGITDITDKHPNGPPNKKLARLETVCKYYSLISKIEVEETIQYLEGQRVHDSWTWMSCKCPYCGDHISKSRSWKTVAQVTQAIWTHLGTCDKTTNCQGPGPGLDPEEIKPFDEYPVLIEARMSKEGLLSFESILEESLVRCMESVMNSRVKWFESLVEDWGPNCSHAQTGCQAWNHDTGKKEPWVATFNIPLLESIASGHFFDRSFAPVREDLAQVRRDNEQCLKLLEEWKSKFPANYKNNNLKMFKKGEGLTQEFLSVPRTAVLGPGRFERHPELHPTRYRFDDPNDIRLILPTKGILPMGCAKGVVGYGMIHPNLINAAVLQTYGLSSQQGQFDAMSLAPNFDLAVTQQQATEIAARLAEWSTGEIDLGDQGDLIIQTPYSPSKENMRHHRDFIDPTMQSVAQKTSISQVKNVLDGADEVSWLIPPMTTILQSQGTNTRALCFYLLQCREDKTNDPQLTEATIHSVIETVIKDNWLQLESEEILEAVKSGAQSLQATLESKTALERDIFLWNYAGVVVQTGEWRRFHSLEEVYVLLATFWGMKAPVMVPTCTTWSGFHDEGAPVQLEQYRQHKLYLNSLRRSPSPSRRGPRSETPAPRTPIQTPKPPPTLEDLVTLSDTTWNPSLHQGLDYLWAIMQDKERESFLRGLRTQQESTSMSTIVPIISDETRLASEPTQVLPTEEEQEQVPEMTMEDPDQPVDQPDAEGHREEQEQAPEMTVEDPDQPVDQPDAEGHQEEPGDVPGTSTDQPELLEVKKESDSVKQEDDQPDDDLTADDLISQVATAGSVGGDAEPLAMLQPTQVRRNNLARYRIGDVGLDTFIDIFNVLSAVASRYVDSVGTFVRKLNLSEAPARARELIGEHDPIFVFIDSEIEEAICSMAGDLSELRRRYPSPQGIDWLSFQYHLTLLQKDGPTGWDAPGFRMGGRIPMSVADICQNLITHNHFTHCHSTPFRDWQRVRHMNTLRRNPETRKNYAYEAVSALALYCKREGGQERAIRNLKQLPWMT